MLHPIAKQIILYIIAREFPDSKKGRPRANSESVLLAIDFVLRSGISWRQLSETNISSYDFRTINRIFQTWNQRSIFQRAYKTLLRLDRSRKSKSSPRYAIDSSYVKNQYGVDCLGRNPTDRGRKATKMSAIVDARGIPVSITYYPANFSDFHTVEPSLANSLIPLIPQSKLYADKGYDSHSARECFRSHGLQKHYFCLDK